MVVDLKLLASWIAESKFFIAFTGAGISTESGIPDFRSPGGVWAKSQPVLFQDFLSSPEARYEYWRQKSESHQDFSQAHPNITHLVLADWEQRHILRGVITQNIDGLHQAAGNYSVLELHGTARQVSCLNCQTRFDADPWVEEFLKTDVVPACPRCQGLLKHATISFGQALDHATIDTAADWAVKANLFLALGSSLVVYPAASLPEVAKQRGAKLVIINRDATPLDPLADMVIHAPLGATMTTLQSLLSEQNRETA